MIDLTGIAVKALIYESANSLVYRAIKQPDNTAVILKVLKEDYPTPAELTRYKQEYEMTRSLKIEGVIQADSFREYHRTLVLIFEDFGGESLHKLMQTSGEIYFPMPLTEFLRLSIKITEILARIHGAQVIHKDINPGNIVLNPETGQVKIIDFGISTRLPRTNPTLSHPNVLEGTLAYISPEQTGRMNRSLDYRTDFYSLGVTFYELLTGHLPFSTRDVLELVHCHIAKQPIPPDEFVGTDGAVPIPKTVSDIVMKLMAKTAEERYQSAWGIVADLKECLFQLENTGRIEEFILGRNDISEKFQIPQKLYGREAEVAILLAAFERVANVEQEENTQSKLHNPLPHLSRKIDSLPSTPKSNIELMLVAGYSGIGKSVLVAELYKPVTKQKGYFISGKFDQLGRNIPYSSVVNALASLVQQLLTENETQLNQWREQILSALGSNGQVIIDVIPDVELIIGKQPHLPDLGVTESQNRFNLVFQNFIRVFCSREHPLVIFLDDLQWADTASLKLIQLMMTDVNTQYLFLIGAYRDNEVNSTHPLGITLERLRQEGVIIHQITLTPLGLTDVSQLIVDTLNSDLETVKPLAELVIKKTEGNPFFVKEFLQTLYAKNLIVFSSNSVNTQGFLSLENSQLNFFSENSVIPNKRWQWNISEIEAIGITDNVVELIISSLKKLPESTQNVLRLAACIGANFDLTTLSIISEKSIHEVFQDLREGVQQGLILPISELDEQLLIQDYQFRHDRIQQAAYNLIVDEDKKALHLQIGRLFLQNTFSDQLSEKIFAIVDHLNLGIELILQSNERTEIARLNLMAGKKAKAATAYDAAVQYFNIGRKILEEDSWDTEYQLTLELYVESVESEYLNANYEQVEILSTVVFQRANSVLDKVKTYGTKILSYSAHNQMQAAIDTGLEVLELLGISLSQSKPQKLIVEELYNLPRMSDPYKQKALWILMILFGPAYTTKPALLPLISFTMVELCINYGNSPLAAYAYGLYGLLLCGVLGDIELGYQLGKLALRLLDKFEAKDIQCRVYNKFYSFIINWKDAVRKSLDPLRETIQIGLETGEVEFTCYASVNYCHNLALLGEPLGYSLSEIQNYIGLIQRLKQQFQLYYAQIWGQFVLNLNTNVENKNKLIGEVYNEDENRPILIEANNASSLYCLYLAKNILNYLFKNYEQAVVNASLAEKYEPSLVGLFPSSQNCFYYSLALLAQYPNVSSSEQIAYLEKVATNQKKLKDWVKHAPMNYLHKHQLVEAGKLKILGQYWEATELYEQAIQGAKENQYLHEEALAYELAAEFYLTQGRTKIAQAYMAEAHYCYRRWQAISKVRDLEERYPQFFEQKLSSTVKTTTSCSSANTNISSSLDLTSVLKASQALSSELALETLLIKMMKIVIENAAAQTGYLILNQDGQWMIEASGTITSDQVQVLQSIPLETVNGSSETPRVSNAIANYVIRTQKSLVLNDAAHEGEFTHDPYILKVQPKSILCTPLTHQGKRVGILYLENNLTTGAFTAERLEVLNLLSSQAAISIENAKLYAQLRESESKWTQILEAVPVGVSVHNPDGRVAYINQSGQRILGQGVKSEATQDELAETYQTYIAGTDQTYPIDKLPAIRALNGETVILEDLEIHQDGIIIPLEVRTTPVLDEQGNIKYGVIAFQDISERRKAEKLLANYNRTLEAEVTQRTVELTQINQQLEREIADRQRTQDALQQSEARYRAIIEDQTELVSRFLPDGTLTFINEAYCRYFGVKQEELIGKHYAPIVFEDDLEYIEQQVKSISRDNPVVVIENRVIVAGKVRWTQWINRALFNQQGDLVELQSVGRDISDKKQVELALQKSEQRYRQIVETADEGIWVIDAEGNTIFANPKMAQMLGYKVEEMVGMSVLAFMDEEWQATATRNLKRRRQGIAGKHDFKFRRKDGLELWTTIASSPIFDISGQYQGALGMITDITQRKYAEEELQRSEERLQLAFEGSGDGFWDWNIATGEIYWSPQWFKMLGYEVNELPGELSTWQQVVHPDDLPWITQKLNAHLQDASVVYNCDYRLRTKSGEWKWISTYGKVVARDEQGVPLRMAGIHRDISDERQAKEALQQSERLFRLLAEISPVGIFRSDASGQTIYANDRACQIVGASLDEVLRWQWSTYIHPEDANRVHQTWQYAMTHQVSWQDEYRLLHREGRVVWVLAQAEAERDETGKVVGYVGTLTDISDRKATEITLRQQKELLQAIFDHIPVMLCFYDAHAQVQLANRAMENTLGWSLEELRHINIMAECYPDPDYRASVLAFMMRADGTWRDIQLRTRAGIILETCWANVRLPDGSQVGIGQDITARKRAELALHESEERWHLALRGTNDGIWDWNIRTNTVFLSPRWKEMRGFAEDEISNSIEEWSTRIHPEDHNRVMQALADHFAQKTSLFSIEYRVRQKNNNYIWVLDRGQAIWDETGNVVRMAGSETNITPRKQAEEALRESENRFRAVFEQAAVGIGLCTLEGQFFRVNQKLCDIVGYSRAEMLERTFQSITTVKDRPQLQASVHQLLAGAIKNYSLENRYICKDGSVVWANIAVSLRHEPNGEPKCFIYVAEDISDRKRAEEALQQAKLAAEAANQAKSAFLANMSHELRTPLNAVLGFSQLLHNSSKLPPEHKKHLSTIIRSGEHLLTLINQVLDLSKIEAGRTALNETDFNLYRLLDDLEDLFQLKANHKRLQLHFDHSPDVPQYIRTDEVKLRQVLINLLSNAMKFTASGGVSLRVRRAIGNGQENINCQLQFAVEDTGAGIADEELDCIFEAFVQTKTGQQFQAGTGLGLTITRKFVELMGGEISVTSQVGCGTTFTFDIRVQVIEAPELERQQPTRCAIALEPNQPSYRILIVDDVVDNRQVLSNLLSPFGFELQEASHGLEAIAIWEAWQPHLILMDMRMPVMNGYEATQRIKSITKGQATAIIAVTASSLEEERVTILSAGCDDFIRKPFKQQEILDALHKHIGVRFVYHETTAAPTATETDIQIPSALATLPPDLVAGLHTALIELDVKLIETLITEIREHNETLANALATFANNFQYEELLNFISFAGHSQ